MYYSKFKVEPNMKIQLSSNKSNSKEIYKNDSTLFNIFFFIKWVYYLKMLFLLTSNKVINVFNK